MNIPKLCEDVFTKWKESGNTENIFDIETNELTLEFLKYVDKFLSKKSEFFAENKFFQEEIIEYFKKKSNGYLCKITVNGYYLYKIFDVLKQVITKFKIEVEEDNLKIYMIDDNNTTIILITIRNSSYIVYNKGIYDVGIDTFTTFLNCKNKDRTSLIVKEDGIEIFIKQPKGVEIRRNYVKPDGLEIDPVNPNNLLKIDYNLEFSIPQDYFNSVLSQFGLYSNELKVKYINGGLIFSEIDVYDKYLSDIPIRKDKLIIHKDETEEKEFETGFSISLLNITDKLIAIDNNSIPKFYLNKQDPIRIDIKMKDFLINNFIAPRVEMEDEELEEEEISEVSELGSELEEDELVFEEEVEFEEYVEEEEVKEDDKEEIIIKDKEVAEIEETEEWEFGEEESEEKEGIGLEDELAPSVGEYYYEKEIKDSEENREMFKKETGGRPIRKGELTKKYKTWLENKSK